MFLAAGLLSAALACGDRTLSRDGASAIVDRFGGKLEPCAWPGYTGLVLCGHVAVPEDRSAAAGRAIDLRIAVLPATGDERPATDAVAFLAGGGVAPATRYLPFLARAAGRLRRSRDLVLVDQRGTGGSNPLACDLPEPHEVESGDSPHVYAAAYLEALATCRAAIESHSDPTLYTTPHAADDLDEVRRWLGYEQLSLWGASYGTKVAQVYMRRYPGRVRAAALHGVVPISFSLWPDLVASADSALGALFDLCAADDECASAFPHLEATFDDLVQRLGRSPARLRVPLADLPSDSVSVSFDSRSLAQLVIGSLRSSRSARSLPRLIDRLSRGDFTPAVDGARPGVPPVVPRGVYLSITCAEELSRLTAEQRARARRSTRLGAGEWVDDEERECSVWGAGTLPDGFWDPVASDVPVLLLTGSEDYVTPPAYAESVAVHLSEATLRVVPQRSHDDVDPCVSALIEDFLLRGGSSEPDLACPEDRGPLPFDPPQPDAGEPVSRPVG